MTFNESWSRKKLREADAKSHYYGTDVLSILRTRCVPAEFSSLLVALRTSAPKTYAALTLLGPRSTSDLVWSRPALTPLTLEFELEWASVWLSGHAARLNVFRAVATEIQALVIASDLLPALTALDSFVAKHGWSLWAVELRAALLQLIGGTDSQRAWLDDLQSRTINSIPGLLFQMFGDRNDDTFSYEAVYRKCMNSFPRFEGIAPWLVDYLKFRALANVDGASNALPGVLSRDISSSLIDYYEDVIEVLFYVECQAAMEALRPKALRLISNLRAKGFRDHRLEKLEHAMRGTFADIQVGSEPSVAFRSLYAGSVAFAHSQLPPTVSEALTQCQNEGAAAHEVMGDLLKWGLNLRSLDIGPAVAMSAITATSGFQDERVLPLSVALLTGDLAIDDAAALGPKAAIALLQKFLRQRGVELDTEMVVPFASAEAQANLQPDSQAQLIAALQLLKAKRYEELARLTAMLRDRGPYWERQCAKLDALSFISTGKLPQAVNLLEEWFRKNKRYAREFPSDVFFETNPWSRLRDLDVVKVGIVAHYEFEANGNANVGYVCKMACRAFLQSGLRQRVADDFESASEVRKMQLTTFLRDVWIEENLSMCHQFESTSQVRDERMAVIQLLLGWDEPRALEYSEAIRQITLSQTLQRGLERIDQTRVFVNESAISRWAEKELEADYDRWRRLSESSSGSRAVDDLLRQYVLDPSNMALLTELTSGKPTASDVVLLDILDRLYKRFLLDPTEGLDAYLSVRIRHGSLRGTILGPLEEQGLLFSAESSGEAFDTRWSEQLGLTLQERATLEPRLQVFSSDVRRIVEEFINDRIQVQSDDKPQGAFPSVVVAQAAKIIVLALAERPLSFSAFLNVAYGIFWQIIEAQLNGLRDEVSNRIVREIRARAEALITELRELGSTYLPLITTLTTASTTTKSQCDTVADWFKLPSYADGESYELRDAISIASAATRNVHRSFTTEIETTSLPVDALPLTTSALSVLMDCLFVVFENAWKHSGFLGELPAIALAAEYDPTNRLLMLRTVSAMTPSRRAELLAGELSRLRTKYLGELPLELVRKEGGSGFPKLARLARSVPVENCPTPFDFGIEGNNWFTQVTVPLYERDGAFDAYDD
ncbi:hypothetical protein J2W25_000886 [Variovorax boronicumulans]|uniref:Uncharacterized protein n=1 Tax=Variovorax boronicumulans TaxID=436515 RepID=A0AAW8DRJ9_9BURK|nr:hypothetical protein [Variovorax boronicumulans]MDP9877252.1 hypothetical protein [Variovorax boronicumulans]MDP9921871.1 hypothetical protein [Variovorax boronicumulans]